MRNLNTYTKSVKGFTTEYGKEVRRLRVLWMDDTQEEFAKKIGISSAYLCQIELGRVVPSEEVKSKIDRYMKLYMK